MAIIIINLVATVLHLQSFELPYLILIPTMFMFLYNKYVCIT
jgi:hypothetical protein